MRGNKLTILNLIEARPRKVSELCEATGLSAHAIWFYLAELRALKVIAAMQSPHPPRTGRPPKLYFIAPQGA